MDQPMEEAKRLYDDGEEGHSEPGEEHHEDEGYDQQEEEDDELEEEDDEEELKYDEEPIEEEELDPLTKRINAIKDLCAKKNGYFGDTDFPPNDKSLYKNPIEPPSYAE